MKTTLVFSLGAALVLGAAVAANRGTSTPAQPEPVVMAQLQGNSLMQQKLRTAQDLLGALSIGDFDRMIRHSDDLIEISLEARWSQPHSVKYGDFGEDFRRGLRRVSDAALDQNIDAAALAYVQVVMTCVECHRIVREGEEIAGAQLEELTQPIFERRWMAAAPHTAQP